MNITLLLPSELSPTTENQLQDLFRQLNDTLKPVPLEVLLAQGDRISIAICREDDVIIGMGMMAEYAVISGRKGWIEDVVVRDDHRGRGIGRKLMEKLIEVGHDRGLNQLFLFTGYHREAANRLYRKLGFQKKESNLYTLSLAK